MKKYVSSEFVATQYGIYKASQDIITSFPSNIIANGSSASAIIKGNMEQSGTPTPTTPIYPTECGDLVTSGEHTGEYMMPIISGGVTTNIYLSNPLRKIGDYADTIAADGILIRNIGIYKMRGTETWQLYGGNYFTNYFDTIAKSSYQCVCTQLKGNTPQAGGGIWIGSDASKTKIFSAAVSDVSSDLDTFKAYLSDQYSANTPVTVWYVLATPTTEQITMPTIPTTAGSQIFNIDTTLNPSEVDLTYTGWHMYDEKKRTGGEWS